MTDELIIKTKTLRIQNLVVGDDNSVLKRSECDTRYGRRIYYELASDVSNGAAGVSWDTGSVTLPVGRYLVRGAIFTTRNVTTSGCKGYLMHVSGGTVTGRVGRNTWHAATYNGNPYTFVTGGSFMDPGTFSASGVAILGGVAMDTAAAGSKVMVTQGEGFVIVTGSPAVLRFGVEQTTADEDDPAILKASETWAEFIKI
jgi:hypothetical protein